jgi:signal transduction histidine kinase
VRPVLSKVEACWVKDTRRPVGIWQTLTRNRNLMDVAGLLTLIAVTVFVFVSYDVTAWQRWPALLILLLFFPLLDIATEPPFDTRREYLRLAVATILTAVLFYLHAHLVGIIVLYFVLSAHALTVLPARQGMIWIVLFGLLTAIFMADLYENWWLGLINGVGAFAGYYFIGAAAHAQRRAEIADAESQRLLDELRAAHTRLQKQAAHAEVLAAAEERNRLARDLHDTLGHRLTVAAVQLEAAQRLIDRDPERAETLIKTVRAEVADGLTELRQTVAALRVPPASTSTLIEQLRQVSHNFSTATNIPVAVSLPAILPPISPALSDACFRVAQESLTNIQRHAGADHVSLRLAIVGDDPTAQELCLTIIDDGVGFDPTAVAAGYGLHGMQERAMHFGGVCTIQTDDQGTCVRFALPVQPTAHAEEVRA